MKTLQLKVTDDGSHTLFSTQIDEYYHSTYGSVQESQLIFIEYGFNFCKKNEINILEIGFGTGLNAFLTLIEADIKGKKVNYTGLELHPIEMSEAKLLNFPEIIEKSDRNIFEKIHMVNWGKFTAINQHFKLKKTKADFTNVEILGLYDLVYFDAFSPEKQAEMWTTEMFRKIHQCCAENGVLTTYCCKGSVKRALKNAGFLIEKLPGPAGKREVIRAIKR